MHHFIIYLVRDFIDLVVSSKSLWFYFNGVLPSLDVFHNGFDRL